MKRTTYPKTKVFALSLKAFTILMASFRVFLSKEHTPFFKDFVMSTSDFQSIVSLSDFIPSRPVKGVDIILHYE